MGDAKDIKQLYKDLSYFDYYGSSIVFLILLTIVFIAIGSYCFVIANIQTIKDDWPNQRCNPRVMPFAGLINKPDDMSYSDFTSQNFAYCSQNIISSGVGKAVEPLTFVVSSLVSLVDQVKNSLNAIRDMVDNVRTNLQNISQEIMGRIANIMIPLQQIIVVFKDIIGKVQGTMTATLMTVLGSYYTLKSLMGAIAEIIIRFLIGLVITIIICLANPFGWALAPVLTGVFVSISIYMTIILVFLKVVLSVEPAMKLPKLNACFDKDTLMRMKDGSNKKISDVRCGDVLEKDGEVTSLFKLDATSAEMYDLNGVVVSSTHTVNFNGAWVKIADHPRAMKIADYNEAYLYCLNTTSKTIKINDMVFSDWDEVYEDENYKTINCGFTGTSKIKMNDGSMKDIKNIKPRDVLELGEFVYGVVEINGKTVGHVLGDQLSDTNKTLYYHLLTDTKVFEYDCAVFNDYDATVKLQNTRMDYCE